MIIGHQNLIKCSGKYTENVERTDIGFNSCNITEG